MALAKPHMKNSEVMSMKGSMYRRSTSVRDELGMVMATYLILLDGDVRTCTRASVILMCKCSQNWARPKIAVTHRGHGAQG